MKSGILFIIGILIQTTSFAQWTPTLSTPNRGINPPASMAEQCNASNDPPSCPTYNVSGMNWNITAPDPARPITIGWSNLGNHDWVRTMPSGFIEWEDPDGLACINSETIVIMGLGTVTANFAAVKFGSDVASTDGHVNFGYRIYNGSWGPWQNSPNFSIATTNTGGSWSAMASGQRMQIRACADFGGQNQDTRLTVFNTNLGSPLPVRWGNLYIELTEKGDVTIWWQTYEEINNDYFIIERSMDDRHYEIIATVDGAGQSSDTKNYNYLDKEAIPGKTYYYKIKQVDYDGNSDYSTPLRVELESDFTGINIGPNPVMDKLNIYVEKQTAKSLKLNIYSAHGKKMKSLQWDGFLPSYEVDISDFPSGTYFISSNDHEGRHLRFVKILP